MKKKKLFKSKLQMIVYFLIFFVCIFLFILIGKTDFKKHEDTEAKKFSSLYNLVEDDNLFHFSNANDILNVLNGRSGIILMGFPSNKWTNYVADILDDVAKQYGIDYIYYYDFLKDREESNGTYQTIVNKLNVYVTVSDDGKMNLHAPTVLMVKKGEIIAYFDDTAFIKGSVTPEIYYTDYVRNMTFENYKTAVIEYLK